MSVSADEKVPLRADDQDTDQLAETWPPQHESRRRRRRHSCLHFGLILYFLSISLLVIWLVNSDEPDEVVDSYSSGNLSEWIGLEIEFALRRILENIGPAVGAAEGIVVASPSKGDRGEPDYFYTWTRDSALTLSTLQSTFTDPSASSIESILFESLMREYVSSQARLQSLSTRSGDLWSGGLNEPKFNVDFSPFDASWGRPQRDGPALRVIALIPFANRLLDRKSPPDETYVNEHLYDSSLLRGVGRVIKNDLEEVANGWIKPGFDLWEEVNGHHLFNRLVSLRALEEGAALAERLNDSGAATFYKVQSSILVSELPSFLRNSSNDTWLASLSESGGPIQGRTGLDCAIPLSVVHSNGRLSPTDPAVLNTLWRYVRSFKGLYGINNDTSWTDGWALGRYAEDIYDGVGSSHGNPWFICTHATAHALYLAQTAYQEQKQIVISNASSGFWQDIMHMTLTGTKDELSWTGDKFERAVERLGEVADGFMAVSRNFTKRGRMSEQIARLVPCFVPCSITQADDN
ncbi:Six-hairpin glycosidase-like protein, partial [Naematelia encephala]